MGESRNAHSVLVGTPEGERPLGRPRHKWEDNIKMDLKEVGYDFRDWINLAQDRDGWRTYVRAAMNLQHNVADNDGENSDNVYGDDDFGSNDNAGNSDYGDNGGDDMTKEDKDDGDDNADDDDYGYNYDYGDSRSDELEMIDNSDGEDHDNNDEIIIETMMIMEPMGALPERLDLHICNSNDDYGYDDEFGGNDNADNGDYEDNGVDLAVDDDYAKIIDYTTDIITSEKLQHRIVDAVQQMKNCSSAFAGLCGQH
ncbi:hypothetical protein ANN_19872 [Periplaneta americana]|uniref:Uncharacterized protein n=1 Tax=Periplaneta americana TaxID=6978 RepID=A0ABQ8SBA2_PERAM|nr:hypothetical protein ANN_19872 [Periplaneta americana]